MYKKKILIIPFVALFLLLSSCSKDIPFEQDAWRAVDFDYTPRVYMLQDLIDEYILIGMTVLEVTELLGEPDFYNEETPFTFKYRLLEQYGWSDEPIRTKDLILQVEQTNSFVEDTDKIISYEIYES